MISILNRPHELKAHIRGALTNGLTPQEICEIFLQVAIYAAYSSRRQLSHRKRVLCRERREHRLTAGTAVTGGRWLRGNHPLDDCDAPRTPPESMPEGAHLGLRIGEHRGLLASSTATSSRNTAACCFLRRAVKRHPVVKNYASCPEIVTADIAFGGSAHRSRTAQHPGRVWRASNRH